MNDLVGHFVAVQRKSWKIWAGAGKPVVSKWEESRSSQLSKQRELQESRVASAARPAQSSGS